MLKLDGWAKNIIVAQLKVLDQSFLKALAKSYST